MQIFINDISHSVETEGLDTLQQLLGMIESQILGPLGEVVTQIDINELNLSDEDENKFADFPVAQIQELKIRSCKPATLVLGGLDDCIEILPKVIDTISQCIEKLSVDEISEAMDEFIVATDGIQWFTTIFNGALSVYGTKLNEDHEFIQSGMRLSEILTEILEAHSNSDLTSFADLLEYELIPVLEKLISEAPYFKEQLEGIKL